MGGLVSTWIGLREDPRFDFPLFEGSPLPLSTDFPPFEGSPLPLSTDFPPFDGSPLPLSTDFPPFEGSPLPLSTECEGTCDVAEASTCLDLLSFG